MSAQTEQLEREAARTRAEMASSFDALSHRLTGRQIVDETFDYASQTRAGQYVREVNRNFQKHALPFIVVAVSIASICLAAAFQASRRKIGCKNTTRFLASEPDLLVTHEGWGVEQDHESLV